MGIAVGSTGDVVDEFEGESDGFIFKPTGAGGLSDLEVALHRTRRLVVRHEG
jgi:hypothetical protein